MDEKIKKLKDMTDQSKSIVFFGGAGVSTESNIPDFRSTDGLYNQKYKFPPEIILSHSFFERNTSDFFEFYKDKMIFKDAEPNDAHKALVKLEKAGKLKAVITQNIDGLHQKAGSKTVYELHGSAFRNYCLKCHKFYPLDYIIKSTDVPRCECGGIVKPDVVLYEEGLNQDVLEKSIAAISNADMLIVGGTSLIVYPAAGLVNYYNGNKLVLINNQKTGLDGRADLVLYENIAKALKLAVT